MYQRHKWARRQKREAIKVFIHTGKGIDAGGGAEKQGLWRASPDGLAQIPEEIEVSTEGGVLHRGRWQAVDLCSVRHQRDIRA